MNSTCTSHPRQKSTPTSIPRCCRKSPSPMHTGMRPISLPTKLLFTISSDPRLLHWAFPGHPDERNAPTSPCFPLAYIYRIRVYVYMQIHVCMDRYLDIDRYIYTYVYTYHIHAYATAPHFSWLLVAFMQPTSLHPPNA